MIEFVYFDSSELGQIVTRKSNLIDYIQRNMLLKQIGTV